MAANYEKKLITKKGWTKQPNALLRDKDLTSDAFKVISFLLSITGDYHISINGISKTINLSESKVRRATALLQKVGYLKIVKIKIGKAFGYKWMISDVPGVYGDSTGGTSIDGVSMDGTSIDETSMDGVSIDAPYMNIPKGMNTQTMKNKGYEHTEWNEERENRETPSPIPSFQSKVDSSLCSSSEANASPLNSKNRGVTQVITQSDLNIEQAFNRFCEVYPRVGDIEQARTAFFAIPDIDKICQQIANSVEWFEKNGRWNDWATGQKNVSCPQAVKFLIRGDWKEYLKSGATVSEEERLRTILAKSRQTNIFGGSEYGING